MDLSISGEIMIETLSSIIVVLTIALCLYAAYNIGWLKGFEAGFKDGK